MLPRCGSAHRPGGLPWQRTLIHVSSRRSVWIYAPERACTRVIARFAAESTAPLPFGQGVSVQHNRLGARTRQGAGWHVRGVPSSTAGGRSARERRRRELDPPQPTLAPPDHDPRSRGGTREPGEAGRKTVVKPDRVARRLGPPQDKTKTRAKPVVKPDEVARGLGRLRINQQTAAGAAAGQTNKH